MGKLTKTKHHRSDAVIPGQTHPSAPSSEISVHKIKGTIFTKLALYNDNPEEIHLNKNEKQLVFQANRITYSVEKDICDEDPANLFLVEAITADSDRFHELYYSGLLEKALLYATPSIQFFILKRITGDKALEDTSNTFFKSFINISNNGSSKSAILLDLINLKNTPFVTLLRKNYSLVKSILEFNDLDSSKKAKLLSDVAAYIEITDLTLLLDVLDKIKGDDNQDRLIKCEEFINSINFNYIKGLISEQGSFNKLLSFLPLENQLVFALKFYNSNDKDTVNKIVKQYIISHPLLKKQDSKVCYYLANLMATFSNDTEKKLFLDNLGDEFLGKVLNGKGDIDLLTAKFSDGEKNNIERRLAESIEFEQFKQKVNEECLSYLQHLDNEKEFNEDNPLENDVIDVKIFAVKSILDCINQNLEKKSISKIKEEFKESLASERNTLICQRNNSFQRFINALKILFYTILHGGDYLKTKANEKRLTLWGRSQGEAVVKSIESAGTKFDILFSPPMKVR